VYDVDRGDVVQVAGAALLAADGDHVLLRAAARGPADGFYLLDLEHRALTRFGGATQPAEYEFALVDGLVLWNQAGPIEDRDVYDVVWNVARLPVGDRQ
jgi:hypothetical protein